MRSAEVARWTGCHRTTPTGYAPPPTSRRRNGASCARRHRWRTSSRRSSCESRSASSKPPTSPGGAAHREDESVHTRRHAALRGRGCGNGRGFALRRLRRVGSDEFGDYGTVGALVIDRAPEGRRPAVGRSRARHLRPELSCHGPRGRDCDARERVRRAVWPRLKRRGIDQRATSSPATDASSVSERARRPAWPRTSTRTARDFFGHSAAAPPDPVDVRRPSGRCGSSPEVRRPPSTSGP